jgi:hypothetical protein
MVDDFKCWTMDDLIRAVVEMTLQRAEAAHIGSADLHAQAVERQDAAIAAMKATIQQVQDYAAACLATLEVENARLRDYAAADAYCPCCGTTADPHAEGCDCETTRMREARAALARREG